MNSARATKEDILNYISDPNNRNELIGKSIELMRSRPDLITSNMTNILKNGSLAEEDDSSNGKEFKLFNCYRSLAKFRMKPVGSLKMYIEQTAKYFVIEQPGAFRIIFKPSDQVLQVIGREVMINDNFTLLLRHVFDGEAKEGVFCEIVGLDMDDPSITISDCSEYLNNMMK